MSAPLAIGTTINYQLSTINSSFFLLLYLTVGNQSAAGRINEFGRRQNCCQTVF
ncbi:MAG: hypothetical protein ACRC62_00325 [Microcoleus sp.]